MDEDVEIEIQIGDDTFAVRFDNDTPYRGIALEELGLLKPMAIQAAQEIHEYLNKMPVPRNE